MLKIQRDVINQVPPDYYQKGVKSNFFQRLWHTRKLQQVISCIHNTYLEPRTILDVGCASGWFVYQISKQFPEASCYGVDIYKNGIIYGRKKYPRLKLKMGNAEKLFYKSNFFDVVICTEVLEHVENPEKVLREIKRVLKKRGTAIIELDSGSILFSISWYIWRKFTGKVWNDAHLHSFTVDKLERIIRKSGFSISNKKRFNVGMAMIFTIRK